MPEKWKVNVEDVEFAAGLLQRFNKLDLREVELYRNDIKIEPSPNALEEFRSTGLSNKDYVLMELWNGFQTEAAHVHS